MLFGRIAGAAASAERLGGGAEFGPSPRAGNTGRPSCVASLFTTG